MLIAPQGPEAVARTRTTRRWQRHFFGLPRAPHLFGRRRLIRELDVPAGGSVLEIGCGAGRNLVAVARRYKTAQVFGLDLSGIAPRKAGFAGLGDRIRIEGGSADGFDPIALFGVPAFDRIFFSYSLAMIPDWQKAVGFAATLLKPHGQLLILDFGQGSGLAPWLKHGHGTWLNRFGVSPRAELVKAYAPVPLRTGQVWERTCLFRDVAVLAKLRPRQSRLAVSEPVESKFGRAALNEHGTPFLGVF